MKVFNGKIISKFNLLARVRQFIDGWKFKTPKEKFFILYSIPKTLIETVGIRLLGDCRVYWYSYIAYGIIVYYLLLVSHTLYYFGSKGQFMTGTRCICGMGILVSVILSYFTIRPLNCGITINSERFCKFSHRIEAIVSSKINDGAFRRIASKLRNSQLKFIGD